MVCANMALRGAARMSSKKNPPANGRGLVLEDIKRGPLYTDARGLHLLLRLSFDKARQCLLPFLRHQWIDVSDLLIYSYDTLV